MPTGRTDQHEPAATAAPRRTPGRGRRRLLRRLGLGCVGGLVVLALLAGAMLTPLAGLVLRPQVGAALGLTVRGGTIRMTLDGAIELRNTDFVIPADTKGDAPTGKAAVLLELRHGRIGLDWAGPGPLVGRVDLHDGLLRVSKPLDGFDLNILHVRPPAGGGGALPAVRVHRVDLALAEHDPAGATTVLRTLPVRASLLPDRDRPGAYRVTAYEDPARTRSAAPLRFEGSLSPDGFEGKLGAFDLGDFPPKTIPSQLRQVYADLRVGGRVRGAQVFYDEKLDVLELLLDVHGLAAFPAPFADDTGTPARLDLLVPVPVDQAGTLVPLVPASGGGTVRIVQRPAPGSGTPVGWREIQAPPEPGVPGLGERTILVQCDLDGAIEDLRCDIGLNAWLGGTGQPLYEFEVATQSPYTFRPDAQWLDHENETVRGIASLVDDLGVGGEVNLDVRVAQVIREGRVVQTAQGRGDIRDATLRHSEFPYPVGQISGSFLIRDGRVVLPQLRGATPAGTAVLASGAITLDDRATGVDLTIRAFGVPFDDTLTATLDRVSPDIRRIILNPDAMAALDQSGVPGGERAPGDTPRFALGGRADAVVRVDRLTGVQDSTSVTVEVTADRFGLLPEAFALPLIAEDARVLITLPREFERREAGEPYELAVTVRDAQATTTTGGRAAVDLDVRVPLDDTDDQPRQTAVDLRVAARGVPVHGALLAALPGASGDAPLSARRVVSELRPSGLVDADITVARDAAGEVAWLADIRPDGLVLRPRSADGSGTLTLLDAKGLISVDDAGVRGELTARSALGGGVRTRLNVDLTEGTVRSVTSATGLNLATPVEHAVAIFAPDVADALADARGRFRVAGRADITTRVWLEDGRAASTRTTVDAVDQMRFDWLGGRFTITDGAGGLAIDADDGPPIARFERFRANATYNGDPVGRVRLDGTAPLAAVEDGASTLARPADLRVEVQGGRFESALVSRVVGDALGDARAGTLGELEPRGEFDAMLSVHTPAGSPQRPAQPSLALEISPYDLSFTRGGERVAVPWVSGLLTARTDDAGRIEGTLDDLTLGGNTWWATADGPWRATPAGELRASLTLDARINATTQHPSGYGWLPEPLPGPLLAIAPAQVRDSLDAMALRTVGLTRLRGGRLELAPDDEGRRGLSLRMPLIADDLRLGTRDRGEGERTHIARVERAALELAVPGTRNADADIAIDARRGDLWGLTTGHTAIDAQLRDGGLDLPRIELAIAGGRLAGAGSARPPTRAGQRASFELDLAGAGLQTERVIAAVRGQPDKPGQSAGDLDVGLGISGTLGRIESLRGRGSFRIRGGSPVDLPLPIRAAIEVFNTTPLTAARYDEVNGSFYITGRTMAFTNLAAGSDAVILRGLGTVDLGDGALAVDLNSLPRNDSPLRRVLRALRDAIVTVELRGTVEDPRTLPRSQALLGPFAALQRFLGGPVSGEEWQRQRLRAYARQQVEPQSGW